MRKGDFAVNNRRTNNTDFHLVKNKRECKIKIKEDIFSGTRYRLNSSKNVLNPVDGKLSCKGKPSLNEFRLLEVILFL